MLDLPIEADAAGLRWTPKPPGKSLLITGAAGGVATLIAEKLADTYELVGIDVVPVPEQFFSATYQSGLDDTQFLDRLVKDADYVLHLATGVKQEKQGLYSVQLDSTNRILASAIADGTRRVILASSTHAAGWPERELIAGQGDGHVRPSDRPRPDGLYGAAKAYMEALGRFASDASGLPVSALRIGTMRSSMSLQELIDSDELPYLGFGQFRKQRLSRSWLTGADLVDILSQEFESTEKYRLRYVTSSPEQKQWDHEVYTA